MSPLRVLDRFARGARRARQGARCELCSDDLGEAHRHVVDLTDRRLLCSCWACATLFSRTGVTGRYRAVPEGIRSDPTLTFGDSELKTLGVPVGLAFFFRASSLRRWTAIFPSPAGATEAELSDETWAAVAKDKELLSTIEDDVEALLVRRRRDGRCTSLVAPIDTCYELTAILKRHWEGIDGGDEARGAVDGFFAGLLARCVPIRPPQQSKSDVTTREEQER